jgi:hypothetical protein
MAAPILLSVDLDHISVAPGATVEFAVSVQNLTTLLDQVALRVDGIDPSWLQIVPPFLPVFAQSTASARVIVSPPANFAQAAAGLYTLHILGKAQETDGPEGQAATVLEVQPAGDYQMKLVAGRAAGYQETAWALSVQNAANTPLRLHFSGSDKGDALWYKFEPFQLAIPAGGAANTVLTIKAKQPAPSRQAIVFSVSATGEYDLRGGAALAAPVRQLAGQYAQAAPARLMLSINPTQAEGVSGGTYELRVGNPGSIPVTVQLSGSSDDASLVVRLDPALLSLGPQAEARARVDVEATGQGSPGQRQPSSFRIRAATGDGATLPAEVEARFVQAAARKPFPWLIAVLVALFFLFIVCGVALLFANRLGILH